MWGRGSQIVRKKQLRWGLNIIIMAENDLDRLLTATPVVSALCAGSADCDLTIIPVQYTLPRAKNSAKAIQGIIGI